MPRGVSFRNGSDSLDGLRLGKKGWDNIKGVVDESNKIQGMWDPGRSEKSVFQEGVMSSTNCPLQSRERGPAGFTHFGQHGVFLLILNGFPLEFYPSTLIVREGSGTPLQYSCLENPMDGGAWWATVHGVVKSWTRLSNFTFTFHFHALEKEMAIHSSVLAWRIPGTGEPGGLPSMGLHRVGHD